MSPKIKIFLDMDHVLYDWDKSALRLIGVDTNDPEVREIIKKDYTIADDFHCSRSKFDRMVENQREEYWANLELYPWSKDLYRRLSEISDVVFLTSPGPYSYAYGGKLTATKRDFNSDAIILTRHKYYCADENSILIDDSAKNISQFKNHGGHVFKWPNANCLVDGGKAVWDKCIDHCIEYITLEM